MYIYGNQVVGFDGRLDIFLIHSSTTHKNINSIHQLRIMIN